MTPATLNTPPQTDEAAPALAPASSSSAPVLAVRAPLSRTPHREPTGRVTRRTLAASLLLHLLLLLGILLAPGRPERVAQAPADAPGERVDFIDVGAWPAGVPGSLPAGGGAAAPGVSTGAESPQITAAGADSAAARASTPVPATPAPAASPQAPRFPDAVPNRLPPAPAGQAGGAPGAGAPNGPVGPVRVGPLGQPGGGTSSGGARPGGRLGPGYGDSRLVPRAEAVPDKPLTEHERYMRGLAGRIEVYNDSVAEEADHQRRSRNWTVKDKDGREWGVGPDGKLRLGGVTIPIPVSPPIPREGRDREDARRAEQRQREQLDRQEQDAGIDRNFRDRTRATRERADAERQRRREQEKSSEGGSSTTP